jgi:hypothetical protein
VSLEGALELRAAPGLDDSAVDSLTAQRTRNTFAITFIVFKVDQPHPHLFKDHEVTCRGANRKSS